MYVIQGHGEPDPANTEQSGFSEAKAALEKANYEVKPLVLARQGKVPDDASVVIVAGPRTDLLGPEIDALDAYLGRGGKLLAMVNPPFPERNQPESLRKLLGRWTARRSTTTSSSSSTRSGRLFGIGPQVPIVQQYEPHPITRDMADIATLFPLTRSLDPGQDAAGRGDRPAAGQDDAGLLGRDGPAGARAGPGQAGSGQDPKGPLTLAAVATKDKTRIVVYGTANLAVNQFLNVQGNRDFFLNTVSWLAEQEDQISVRPKDTKQAPVFLTAQQAQAVFWLPVVVLPGARRWWAGSSTVVRRRAAK